MACHRVIRVFLKSVILRPPKTDKADGGVQVLLIPCGLAEGFFIKTELKEWNNIVYDFL